MQKTRALTWPTWLSAPRNFINFFAKEKSNFDSARKYPRDEQFSGNPQYVCDGLPIHNPPLVLNDHILNEISDLKDFLQDAPWIDETKMKVAFTLGSLVAGAKAKIRERTLYTIDTGVPSGDCVKAQEWNNFFKLPVADQIRNIRIWMVQQDESSLKECIALNRNPEVAQFLLDNREYVEEIGYNVRESIPKLQKIVQDGAVHDLIQKLKALVAD